jgi:putative ABC transport system permease protein
VSPRDLVGFAVTALLRHRVRSWLSLLGVAIGVSAVVMLTALGEGARRYVSDQFMAIGSNLVIVVPGRNETTGTYPGVGGVPNDLTLDDARALERGIASVRRLAPVSMGNETVSSLERSRQVMVIGTTEAFLEVREISLAQGRFLPPGEMERGGQEAVLGARVAAELFPDGRPLGRVVRVGDWRMRVVGVIEASGTQVGLDVDEIVAVPVATGLRMFNRTSLFRVLLKTHSHEEMDVTCARAIEILKERHDEEDVTCFTQASVVSSLSSILAALTAALAGIAGVSLAVAGIGIMNVMLVSVSERTEEVGLLKAVGARSGQILRVFLAEAVLLAGVGGATGLLFGWLGVRALVWRYPAFPAAMPAWAVAAALAVAMGVGALFGVLPARRATRLDPVAALAGR